MFVYTILFSSFVCGVFVCFSFLFGVLLDELATTICVFLYWFNVLGYVFQVVVYYFSRFLVYVSWLIVGL